MTKYDFFISYSSKDNEIAFKIVNALESAGLRCWIAPRNIPYGTPYARAIMEGIDECEKFIVLITRNSIESEDVLNEVDNAHSLKKTLIPIRLTDVSLSRELNYYLSRSQWLTITSNNPEEILKLLNIGIDTPLPVDNLNQLRTNKHKKTRKTTILIIAAIAVFGMISLICWLSSDHFGGKDNTANIIESTSEEALHTISDSIDIDKKPNSYQAPEQSATAKKEDVNPSKNEKHNPQSSMSYEKMLTDANTFYNHEEYGHALQLYETIANEYDINYADKVGYMYYHGLGAAKSPSKAIEWCKKAADIGKNHDAQIRVGYMSLRAEEYAEAAKYYLEAEKHVILDPESKNDLGYLYFNGLGVTKDLDKAKKYWMEAASSGHSIAKSNMGKYFND